MQLILDIVPPSLNKLFAMNHWSRGKLKKEIESLIYYECKKQKIKKIEGPLCLSFVLTFKKKRIRDIDNYTAGTKFLTDGLRYAGIISDDNSEIVKEIKVQFIQGKKDQTIIEFIKLSIDN